MTVVHVKISAGIATITLDSPTSLNSFTQEGYGAFVNALREIDKRPDVVVTVWQATGRWFCSGANVKTGRDGDTTVGDVFVNGLARANTDTSKALYDHSKILVAALNGPAMGIAAALLGHCDFIYAMPNAWLSTPFSFLGLVAEGGSTVSFINRMGVAKANEMLIWGKKKTAQELFECGFVNKIFPLSSVEEFHSAVREHLLGEMDMLSPDSLLLIKKLLRAGMREKNDFDAVNLRETYVQAERFTTKHPIERFRQLANKEIRHKL